MSEETKTMGNTTASQAQENVSDIQFWGNGDLWKLISKAWSEKEGWMKSTKAMEIFGIGCLVQISTQQGDNVAEALQMVPNVKIYEHRNEDGNVTGRELVPWDPYDLEWMTAHMEKIGANRRAAVAAAQELRMTEGNQTTDNPVTEETDG